MLLRLVDSTLNLLCVHYALPGVQRVALWSPTPAAEVASDGLDLGGKSAQADGHLATFASEIAVFFAKDCQVEQVKNIGK